MFSKPKVTSTSKKPYVKTFSSAWLNDPALKAWIARDAHDESRAWCKVCRTSLRAQKNDLTRHANSDKHKGKCSALNTTGQPSVDTQFKKLETSETKSTDISLAVFTAMHASVNSIDHLTELLKKYSPGTPLSKLRLKRTKCSSIILNVLEPVLTNNLLADVGDKPYSIILDESTDISSDKYLAYCIRYFNEELDDIVVDFLGLQIVTDTTAAVLYESFKAFLSAYGLPYTNLVGLGTDGAANLCATNKKNLNHSLWTLLRADLPNLQLLKCICHSLHKCSEKAMQELPSALEFLLRESHNWFSHSSLRLSKYYEVYAKVYGSSKAPKLAKLSDTRWLVFEAAVRTTLQQWESLKAHFIDITKSEKCYTARTLAAMYNEEHFLYLKFLAPILKELTLMNKKFQANRADLVKLYSELRTLIISYARRIFKPAFIDVRLPVVCGGTSKDSCADDIKQIRIALNNIDVQFNNSLLNVDDVDFGSEFQSACLITTLKSDIVKSVKQKCLSFITHLLREMIERLPQNMQVISKLNNFNPYVAMDTRSSRPKSIDLPWELAPPNCDRESIEIQWNNLGGLRQHDVCGDEMIEDAVKFWSKVSKITNAIGEKQFTDLSSFALRALSLPLSNAVVERVFSIMSIVKTKLRNRMMIPMLSAIMRTRLYLKVRNVCCESFKVTDSMLALHNQNMYHRSHTVRGSLVHIDHLPNEDEEVQIMDNIITLYVDDPISCT